MSTEKNSNKQASFGKLFGSAKKSSKGKSSSGRNSEEDIRKLTRTELLELLIDETKEADRLRAASFEAVIARLESIVNGK